MHFIEACDIKVNLTLRVLAKRADGYHEIHSLFWRIRSPETMKISISTEDRISVFGAEIPGENILSRVCCYLRSRYPDVPLPPLDIELFKHIPMGSGVGAGSGNAAALLRWFRRNFRREAAPSGELARLGADVAFLASDYALALADGVGEILHGIDELLSLSAVFFFPEWSTDTGEAYRSIDRFRLLSEGKYDTINAAEARRESLDILKRLQKHTRVGLLPNDFNLALSSKRACYDSAYDLFDRAGAVAWGLCGSGSACFALFERASGGVQNLMESLSRKSTDTFPWLHKTMVLR